MKNRIISSIAALCIFAGVSGCDDFFEVKPGRQVDLDQTFTNRANTEAWLNNTYSYITDDTTGDRYYNQVSDRYAGPWGLASIEAHVNEGWNVGGQYANTWTQGGSTAASSEVTFWWKHYYKGIASASYFIQNVDKNPELTDPEKAIYKAEARALRAIYYCYIFRQHGPCVLLGNDPVSLSATKEELLKARSSVDDCVKFIVDELDAAAEVFGADPSKMVINGSSQLFGRLDKGQCKALKAKVLLYAASQLYNGDANMATVVNTDGTPLFPQTADPAKWEAARVAYKEFMDEFYPTYYDLHVVETADGRKDYYESYRQATQGTFIRSKEVVWVKLVWHGDLYYAITPQFLDTRATSGVYGGLGFNVTQEYVDMFFTNKGLRIDDDTDYQAIAVAIGETPSAAKLGGTEYNDPVVPSRQYFKANTDQTLKEWRDRDPRFYVCVTYNGSTWTNQSTNAGKVTVNLTTGGDSGYDRCRHDAPSLGYGWRKTSKDGSEQNPDGHMSMNLRFADMVLGYAEVLNETGDRTEALKWLNMVRARVGIPAYTFGAPTTYTDENDGLTKTTIQIANNKTDVENRIRRERMIELASEAARYFDTRRWVVAGGEKDSGGKGDGWVYPTYHTGGEGGWIYGLTHTENSPNFFRKKGWVERKFYSRMYFMPIPQDEIQRNPLLVQNYGWDVAE